MIKNWNRILTMVLCAALLFGMLSGVTALAAEEETETVVQEMTVPETEVPMKTEATVEATEETTEDTTEETTEGTTEEATEEAIPKETVAETHSAEMMTALAPLTDVPTAFAFTCHQRTVYLNDMTFENQNLGLNYSFEPEGTTESIIKAESSDPSILDVEIMDGWLQWHGYKAGTVVVTATTASGLTDSCTVTVAQAQEILCDKPVTVTVHPHDHVFLMFTPKETGNYVIYSEDSNCLVSLWMGYGQKDIQRLTAGKPYGAGVWNNHDSDRTWTVTIKKVVPVEQVQLNLESPFQEGIDHYEGKVGQSIRLRAATGPLWAQYEEWAWSTSDSSVASIDGSGNYRNVTLLKEGTATITVTMESGVSASCVVTVNSMETIRLGESKTLTLDWQEEARFQFVPEVSGKYVFHMPKGETHWDEEGIGHIEEFYLKANTTGEYVSNGYYQGYCYDMEAGKEYILSAANYSMEREITGTVRIDVFRAPDSISIKGETNVAYADTIYLSADWTQETTYAENLTWTSSNPDVLKLEESFGRSARFIAEQEGTATITVTVDGGISASKAFTVVVPQISINSNELHSYISSAYPQHRLDVAITPEVDYAGNYTWTSSDPDVLKLDESYGTVALFAIGQEGSVTITVKLENGLTASRTFTVVEEPEYKEFEVLDVTQGDTVEVHIDGDMELFGSVSCYRLDDIEGTWSQLNPVNYSVTQGSTIVTLHKDYLDSLPKGKYGLNFLFFGGYCHTEFEIGGTLPGDLNNDGKVNVFDINVLRDAILHRAALPEELFPMADVNGDGKLNIFDINKLRDFILHRISEL